MHPRFVMGRTPERAHSMPTSFGHGSSPSSGHEPPPDFTCRNSSPQLSPVNSWNMQAVDRTPQTRSRSTSLDMQGRYTISRQPLSAEAYLRSRYGFGPNSIRTPRSRLNS